MDSISNEILDKTLVIVLTHANTDYKISRFFRFVAGLLNTFLICEKIEGEICGKNDVEENFKILSFPCVKIKRNQKKL